ncbi:MAG: ribonuclease HII [bacterium]
MTFPTRQYEQELRNKGYNLIAGVDEAGRGAWAGPLVAAAVIMPEDFFLDGIRDSKLLNEKKRKEFCEKIKKIAVSWAVGIVDISYINQYNIGRANIKAFELAIDRLSVKPDCALIDGLSQASAVPFPLNVKRVYIKDGDAIIYSIAAASIIAKVTRDEILKKEQSRFPEYGFDKHKGYGTKLHQKALEKNGICAIHRILYKPIKRMIKR